MTDAPSHQSPASAAAPAADRSSIIAVTALPVLVVIAGVLGFFLPDAFTPLAPSITWALGVVMFFMGLTLTLPDFARIAKRPWIAVLGVVTQFVAMPLLGLLVVTVYSLPPEIAVGVILVGCAPGGTASNVVTYLAKGDTALSVSITTLSTLCAPILTPLLTLWLAGSYMDVPFWSMFVSICQTVLVPVIVGVIIRVLASDLVDKISPVLPWLASVAIAYIVAIVVAGSADSIATAGVLVLLAVVTHNVLGLGVGYLALPVTMRNVGDLLWRFEVERLPPAVAEAHLAAREGVQRSYSFAAVHARLGRSYVDDKVRAARDVVEDWVKQGK